MTAKIDSSGAVSYELAAVVSDRVSIESVRLISCKCSQKPQAAIGKHSLKINWDVQTKTAVKENVILVFPVFKLYALPAGAKKSKPDLTLEAAFVLIYKATNLQGIKDKNLDAFGRTNGIYNAWPYWREFAQNMVIRMNLPPLTIPVFRLKSSGQKIQQKRKRQHLR